MNGAQAGKTEGRRARSVIDAIAILALAGTVFLSGWMGAAAPARVLLKMGPNTGFYLQGFAPLYEIEGLLASRWTTYDARIDLPLRVRGGRLAVSYRAARVLPETADVEILLAGRPVDRFSSPGGWFRIRRVEMGVGRDTPLTLDIHVASRDRRNMGLKVDWVLFEVAATGRLAQRGAPLVLAPLLVCGFYLALRTAGHGPPMATVLVLPLAAAAVVGPHWDPLGHAHLVTRAGGVALALMLILALVSRRLPAGRWLLAIVVLAHVVKGVGLHHPTSYYPDYRNHDRYTHELVERSGSLAERSRAAQRQIGVAYPRIVAGKAYAFPYSPLGYVPLAVFEPGDATEEGFKHASLLATSLTLLLVYGLARLLVRGRMTPEREARVAVLAALVAALLPAPYSRLIVGMCATLFAHPWDVGLVMASMLYLRRPSARRLVLVGTAALGGLLIYISSLFTVGAFLVVLALVERRHALRLLAVLGVCSGITVAWLYAPFVKEFFGEILPAMLGGARMGSSAGTPTDTRAILNRIPLFFGWGLPLFAAAGGAVLWRRVDRAARSVLVAYAGAFLLLFSLRLFGGGLFRDLKETTFVGPLAAVLAAVFLDALLTLGRAGRWAVAMVLLGLGALTAERYVDYLQRYASPFLVAKHKEAHAACARDRLPSGIVAVHDDTGVDGDESPQCFRL